MRLFQRVLMLVLIVMVAGNAWAEITLNDMISLNGELRYRSEVNGKDFNADTGLDEASTLRTTFGIKVQPDENFFLSFKIREARFLGTQGANQPPTTSIYATEAYFHLNNFIHDGVALQAGRYGLKYGRSRLIGAANYNVYGPRMYDAVGLFGSVGAGEWEVHYAKTASNSTPAESGERDLHLFVVHTSFAGGSIQPYFLGYYDARSLDPVGVPSDPTYVPGQQDADLWLTPALYAKKKFGALKVELDAAGQFGKNGDRDLSAYLFATDIYYAFDHSMKPVIGAGLDYTSGTTAAEFAAGEDHTFRSPYMSRHTYRGYLDYFKDVDEGMMNILVHFELRPIDKLRLNIDFHNFMYANEKASAATPGDTYTLIGQEVDTRLRFPLHPRLNVDTAWCFLLPSEDYKPNGDLGHYFYLALTGTF